MQSDLDDIRVSIRQSAEVQNNYEINANLILDEFPNLDISSDLVQTISQVFHHCSQYTQQRILNLLFFATSVAFESDNEQLSFFSAYHIYSIIKMYPKYSHLSFFDTSYLLFCEFCQNFQPNQIAAQQMYTNIFAAALYYNVDDCNSKKSEESFINLIYQHFIPNFQKKLNLTKLFTGLIRYPPFPPNDVLDNMYLFCYNDTFEGKENVDHEEISNYLSFVCHFIENGFQANYSLFLNIFPKIFKIADNKIRRNICMIFLKFTGVFPELLDILLFFLSDGKSNHKVIYYVFAIFARFIDDFKKESIENIAKINSAAFQFLRSNDEKLKELCFAVIFTLNEVPLPFNEETAKLLIENVENRNCSEIIFSWFCHWFETENDENLLKFGDLLLLDRDNLEAIILNDDENIQSVLFLNYLNAYEAFLP